MKKEQFIKKIILIEIIGFIGILLIVWLDEIIDIPHLIFRTSATPPNYPESFLESFLIILLAITIIILTQTILKRLKYLEGFLPICSFCKKIRSKDNWIPIEEYIRNRSEADFTHSICPHCMEVNYYDVVNEKM